MDCILVFLLSVFISFNMFIKSNSRKFKLCYITIIIFEIKYIMYLDCFLNVLVTKYKFIVFVNVIFFKLENRDFLHLCLIHFI